MKHKKTDDLVDDGDEEASSGRTRRTTKRIIVFALKEE